MDFIHKQLKDILSIINESEIEYWASGGTLLGAIRHNDIIPWDDDADIEMIDNVENHENLLYLEPYLNNQGFGLCKVYFGYKIYPLNGIIIKKNNWREHKRIFKENNPHVKGRSDICIGASKTYNKKNNKLNEEYKYPYLDIFLVNIGDSNNKFDGQVVGQVVKCIDKRWENFFHYSNDLFPLQKAKLGNIKVNIPVNPYPYLGRGYGKNYMKIGKIYYDHKHEKIIPLKTFLIS
tara:strand:- start:1153 stop:1857 length:705 start_codon:yes stop_codon:yes gene_type:complete